MVTPNLPPSVPPPVEFVPPAPQLSLSAETGGMAQSAVSGIESNIAVLGPAAIGIGIAVFLFKRGIEGILFQKNPLRGLGKDS